jgi:tRNA (cytidine/uridine-2'-O-)-methyltransferase
MLEIALYQPDIAANTGTIARMCACFGLPLTIIEPAGFVWSDSALRRAGMDYLAQADIRRSRSWADFRHEAGQRRFVLLTTKASQAHHTFSFRADDILLFGRESSGVPEEVHAVCERVTIPMQPGMRSLNVAMASAIVVAEAMRQLGLFERPIS